MSASRWAWAACGAHLVQLCISMSLRSMGFPGSSDSDGQSFSHSSEFSIHTSFFAEQHSAGVLLPLSAVVWKETSPPPRCLKCGMVCRCFIGLSGNITFNSVSYEKTMCPVPISLTRKAGLGPSGQNMQRAAGLGHSTMGKQVAGGSGSRGYSKWGCTRLAASRW